MRRVILSGIYRAFCDKGALNGRPLLEIFTSDTCTLCVHFKRKMEPYLTQHGLELHEVRIDKAENTKWFELYKHDIPVLHADGKLLMKHRFNYKSFEDYLRRRLRQ